ncbi:MAG: hypothetical protein O7F71_05060 [Gammaproteobacteria bacterium]|nr:hypothetical protein [Gammaproteobacteria bacterium]
MARPSNKGWRRAGISGIAFGLTSFALCELPLVLAWIGLGSFGTAWMIFKPHPLLEVAGLFAAITGIVLIVVLRALRRQKKI